MKGTLVLSTAALILPALVAAEPMEYSLDMNHSRVFFDVDHQGYSMMRGMFRSFDGTLMYDEEDPSASSVSIDIDASSVDMYHDGLNNHLKNDDFFGVETHPSLMFESTSVEDLGDGQLRVNGNLTMIGQTHPVTLDAVLNQAGVFRGGPKIGFSATGSLDRTAYGMNFGAGNIGTDVNFSIEIEATRPGEGGAPAGMGMGMGMGQ